MKLSEIFLEAANKVVVDDLTQGMMGGDSSKFCCNVLHFMHNSEVIDQRELTLALAVFKEYFYPFRERYDIATWFNDEVYKILGLMRPDLDECPNAQQHRYLSLLLMSDICLTLENEEEQDNQIHNKRRGHFLGFCSGKTVGITLQA
jgi:hypothetical protein